MGRMYSASFENVAVTAAQDFFELSPADDKPIAIHQINIGQFSDLGDTAEEILRVQIIRGFTASGLGGSTFTPVPLNPNDTASGITSVEINNTTVANTGTGSVCFTDVFNIRTGWIYLPTPECRIMASQANTTIVVRLLSTPTDSLSMSGCIIYEELN